METVDFEALNLLLKAPSKDVVVRLCNEVFLYRKNFTLPPQIIQTTAADFSIDNQEASKMLEALRGLIKNALFRSCIEPSEIVSLFPNDFHKNLRDLLGKIILENMPTWRETAITGLVSLPRLVDFDWRVDVKTSSDCTSRLAVPSCVLQLQVQETTRSCTNRSDNRQASQVSGPGLSDVTVELSKETLDTMLDGLGKIRDQLSSVVKKT